MVERVIFIGAGNLATSLALGMQKAGFTIAQIISRSSQSAGTLADRLGTAWLINPRKIVQNADLYVIAVTDTEIPTVLRVLPPLTAMVVHTSGSTPIDVFNSTKFPNHGVIYPFQTFSKSRVVDLQNVSFCVEANNQQNLKKLTNIASRLSSKVVRMNSEQRKWLHLTGVFGSNFVNAVLALAYQVASSQNIDFEIVKPLVEETVQKAFGTNPSRVQTGPAVRNDLITMQLHEQMLQSLDPQIQKMYNLLSNEIQRQAQELQTAETNNHTVKPTQ